MRAKIRQTGEIVEIVRWGQSGTYTDYIDEKGQKITSSLSLYDDFILLDKPVEQDWNSIRTQAAIAAMQGMVSNHDLMCSLRSGDEKEKKFSPYICINVTTKLAEKATKYADALIAELKKGE